MPAYRGVGCLPLGGIRMRCIRAKRHREWRRMGGVDTGIAIRSSFGE